MKTLVEKGLTLVIEKAVKKCSGAFWRKENASRCPSRSKWKNEIETNEENAMTNRLFCIVISELNPAF